LRESLLPRESGQERFLALDAFRGVAAFGVALFHFRWTDTALQASPVVSGLVMLVDFFFVLSGFVLAHAYFGQGGSIIDFVRKRLARLYPLHAFALLVFLGLQGIKLAVATSGGDFRQAAFAGLNGWNFVDTLLLLQSTGLLWHEISWNSPSWSISTELFANVIVFGLRAALGSHSLNLICSSLLISIVAFFLLTGVPAHDYGPLALLRCIATFCLGCLIYSLHRWTCGTRTVSVAPTSLATVSELLALGVLLIGVVAMPLTGVWLASAACFAVVIYVFAFEGGWVSRVFKRARLPWLGTISYSIYLNHIAVGSLISAAFLPVANKLGWSGPFKIAGFIVLFFAILSVYSWLTYRLIERPAQRYFWPRGQAEGR
jgi:peptidoglycan/LPS O-acetylase OafA/YrhL